MARRFTLLSRLTVKVKEKWSCKIHSIIPTKASYLAPVSTWLPSLHKPCSYQLPFSNLLQIKFQNTCWWLKNTAYPLDHYRNNKGNLIKSSWMPVSCGMQWHGARLRNVPGNLGCFKFDEVDSTSREEDSSFQTNPKQTSCLEEKTLQEVLIS